MPPKFKFTREQIIREAVELVREEGADALTARSLAERLGSSPKPIFGLFSGMQELMGEVIGAAALLYESYISESIQSGKYPPYKASGMGYIRFAKEQPELFKLLYMRDRSGEHVAEDREAIRPILNIIMENYGLDEDTAFLFHLEMWIYVHGIATMLATAYLDWDMDFVSEAVTDMFMGLRHRFEKEKFANDGN